MHKYTKFLKWIAIAIQVMMPFFHKPSWCIEKFKDNKDMFENCGFNAGGIDDFYDDPYDLENKIPNVGIPASTVLRG